MLFREMSIFLQLLAQNLTKTPKHASLREKLVVSAKSIIFHAFSRNEWVLQLLAEKLTKTPKDASLLEKFLVWAKSMIFYAFSRNDKLSPTFGRKLDENAETC